MASPSLAVKLLAETERSLAGGLIGPAFATMGTATTHAAVLVRFYNQTDQPVSFSFDGTSSSLSLAPGVAFDLNAQTNKGVSDSLMVAKGTQFYARQTGVTAPTTGSAFISVFYATTNSEV